AGHRRGGRRGRVFRDPPWPAVRLAGRAAGACVRVGGLDPGRLLRAAPGGGGRAVPARGRAPGTAAGRCHAAAEMARGACLPALRDRAGRDRLGGRPSVPGAAVSAPRRQWRLTWIASPFVVWGLHFVAVYSIQGLACGRAWPVAGAWLGMGLATAPAFAAVA